MSRPSHAVPDFRAPNGLILHADIHGSYHDGPQAACEKCRVLRWRQLHAIAAHAETVKNAEAVKPRMNASEAETVRAVNVLLKRDKPENPNGWLLLIGLASAGAIWCLAVYGAVCLFR